MFAFRIFRRVCRVRGMVALPIMSIKDIAACAVTHIVFELWGYGALVSQQVTINVVFAVLSVSCEKRIAMAGWIRTVGFIKAYFGLLRSRVRKLSS